MTIQTCHINFGAGACVMVLMLVLHDAGSAWGTGSFLKLPDH